MPSVIIADDEEFVRYFLRSLLDSIFFEVTAEIDSGDKLHSALLEYKPDIIILDINMPNLKGNEFLLNHKHDLEKTCVIVLTVSTSKEIQSELENAGFKYFLRKNTSPEAITSFIQKAWNEFSKGVYNV